MAKSAGYSREYRASRKAIGGATLSSYFKKSPEVAALDSKMHKEMRRYNNLAKRVNGLQAAGKPVPTRTANALQKSDRKLRGLQSAKTRIVNGTDKPVKKPKAPGGNRYLARSGYRGD